MKGEILLMLAGAVTLLFPLSLFNSHPRTEEVQSKVISVESSEERFEENLPIRLRIPAIDLDTEIEYVGLTSDGKMDTPKDIAQVGWFEEGTVPGNEGSAVIAGHYGWKDGKASAFDELHTLREGDTIYVEDETGNTVPFIVSHTRSYSPEDDATEVFTSTDDKAHLNLVTCAGEWNGDAASYAERLIIFSTRAP